MVLPSPEEEKDVLIEGRKGGGKQLSSCLSGIPGFIATPDFSQLCADVAICRNMLQPEERGRAERFKREKVEKQKWWGERGKDGEITQRSLKCREN